MHPAGREWTGRGVAALVATLVGCTPLGDSEDVIVIARGDDGTYGLHPRLVSADDFHALVGDTAEFIARPTVVVADDGSATIEGGEPLDVEYTRDGGALVALDYQGLIAVTAYHHLAQSHAYFRRVGLDRRLGPLKALYLPLTDYGGSLGTLEFHDNASYAPSINAFLLFEERWLDYVPLAANEGIITHEFAHAVFHALTGGPDPTWDRASRNLWRSIDEGLADVHAVAFTGDPTFGRASGGIYVGARNVAASSLALTEELLATTLEDTYDPYPIGTVLAAVFWDYRGALIAAGRTEAEASREMGELAYRTARDLDSRASAVELAGFAEATAEETAGLGRQALCGALVRHAELIMPEVPACP